MADTPQGETVTPGDSQTTVPTAATTPVVNAVDPAEVERLRKEREQIEMERNQLRNQLAEREKAEAEAKAKQLEEQGKWKEIADAKTAELERLQREQDEKQRQAELNAATDNVLKEYPANVVDIAKTAGLSLPDDSEESIAAFKDKLETIKKQVVTTATPSANNPHNPTPAAATREELMQRMRGGDKTAVNEYIRDLPAIKRMKEIANGQF